MEPGRETRAVEADPLEYGVPRAVAVATASAYDRHAGEIHGFLVRAVRDREVAADLCADTFARLLIEERAGRWPELPRAWLFRVASNLAASRGRRLQVAARFERLVRAQLDDRSGDSPDEEVLRRERDADLDRALGTLPADARLAVLLAAQGFDGIAIAATIGRTHGATRTLLSRARAQLRQALQEGAA